jgi:hypothetical protein
MAGRGRVLAVKLGLNPNSSSLGGDVTFLLLGATALGMLTPIIAALLRFGRATPIPAAAPRPATDAVDAG